MDQATAKQQVIERLKQANNILVTVSNNPSVDQLTACIGMTLFLNKLDKHATAVFSGRVPNVIEFLQPEKTLEPNTDSLRDFIISLDKAKADKLRYKVEDKFVRIYITPYRTSISQKDLVFAEGDFNVDVVLALGVRDKVQLDAAITQHGRILHDAHVISVNAGAQKAPEIGQINWQDAAASSLCEMLVSISEAFGTGLLDGQMATSFLTGIVAETQRFSNQKTSPKVMTMAAQLMAAGANQQLIVSKLEPPPPPAAKAVAAPPPTSPPSDTLNISHEAGKQDSGEVEVKPGEIKIDEQGNIVSKAPLPPPIPAAPVPPVPSFQPPVVLPPPPPPPPPPVEAPKVITPPSAVEEPIILPDQLQPRPNVFDEHPTPAPDLPNQPKIRTAEPLAKSSNGPPPQAHELLDPVGHKPSISPPFTADTQPQWFDPENSLPIDPLSDVPRPNDAILEHEMAANADSVSNDKVVTPPDMPKAAKAVFPEPESNATPTFPTPVLDNARDAVQDAIAAAPYNPALEGPVAALNAQPLSPELHDEPKAKAKPMELPVPSAPTPPPEMEKPAPPPVPPPLKLDSGTLIPTTATPVGKR